jgi:2-haloacid dehalogenase
MTHPAVKTLVFDVFGSVVDWRGSIARDLGAWSDAQGIRADWLALAEAWRARYQPQMERVRSGEIGWRRLDDLHLESLRALAPAFGLDGLDEAQLLHVNRVWHRLDPWPDAVPGLKRLKARYLIGTLSNGNVALLVNMAKRAALPWDVVVSAETFRHYKPQREAYLGVAELLDIAPHEVMMCAAHNADLEAARAAGLATAFFARPHEHGPAQTTDLVPTEAWDVVARDIEDLATQMGC